MACDSEISLAVAPLARKVLVPVQQVVRQNQSPLLDLLLSHRLRTQNIRCSSRCFRRHDNKRPLCLLPSQDAAVASQIPRTVASCTSSPSQSAMLQQSASEHIQIRCEGRYGTPLRVPESSNQISVSYSTKLHPRMRVGGMISNNFHVSIFTLGR